MVIIGGDHRADSPREHAAKVERIFPMGVAVKDPYQSVVVPVSVEYVDFHKRIKNAGFTLRTAWAGFSGADDAAKGTAVSELGTLIDAVSNARICEIMVSEQEWLYGGDAATNNGHWFEVSDEMVLNFRSASRCRVTKSVIILAPVNLCFTGVDEIIVNNLNAAVADLIAFLELNLAEPKYGLQNFEYMSGYRRKVELPTPTVF